MAPLLAIEATKPMAQRTAEAIATALDDEEARPSPLAALAATRLGERHPLVATLRRGVGFHHSALPDDIQAELEEALREGSLRYLVATTTLVEGINFPVRTVLVGERGYRTDGGIVTTIDAPRLVNAIGRAGRAGKETEGWIVLSLNKNLALSDFDVLEAADDDLEATSHIAGASAIEQLAEFEDLARRSEDAVLEFTGREVADFISHVWFVSTSLEELGEELTSAGHTSLETTLAWQQFDEDLRQRWRAVAELAVDSYRTQPLERRRRWAKSGTTIPTARVLESLAASLLDDLPVAQQSEPLAAFRVVSAGGGRLGDLLELDESRFWGFRPRRNAPRTQRLDVDVESLIIEWLGGIELRVLCERYLAEVPDETYQYEQLSEFVAQVLEHWLPWALNSLVQWVNDRLSSENGELCPSLAAFVRYGVDSTTALQLMTSGVRSRRLAHVVSDAYLDDGSEDSNLREWLAAQDINTWQREFNATPTELADLLAFTRIRDAYVTGRVLSGERVEVSLSVSDDGLEGPVELVFDDDTPGSILAKRGDETVGAVPTGYFDDFARLLSIGIPVEAHAEGPTLTVEVIDPTESPRWFE